MRTIQNVIEVFKCKSLTGVDGLNPGKEFEVDFENCGFLSC